MRSATKRAAGSGGSRAGRRGRDKGFQFPQGAAGDALRRALTAVELNAIVPGGFPGKALPAATPAGTERKQSGRSVSGSAAKAGNKL